MRQLIVFACSLAAAAAASTRAAVVLPIEKASLDWRPLHYKIFATKGEPMTQEETRDSIGQLLDIYEQQVAAGAAPDKGQQARHDKLKAIAESAKLNPAKCQWDKFDQLNQLIEYNKPFGVNVIPYLAENRRRLFLFCGDEVTQQIQEALGQLELPEDERRIGEDFFQVMVSGPKLEELTPVVDEHKLSRRVNEMLELRNSISKDKMAKEVGDPTYESFYGQLLSQSCSVFEQKLRKIIVDKHHLLDLGLDLFESPELGLKQILDSSKWLRYSQVCRTLKDRYKAIMSTARLEFQDRHMPESSIRG